MALLATILCLNSMCVIENGMFVIKEVYKIYMVMFYDQSYHRCCTVTKCAVSRAFFAQDVLIVTVTERWTLLLSTA